MTNNILIRFILVISIFFGFSNSIYSQIKKPKPDPDYSRMQRSQHHRLNTQTIDIINSNRPGYAVSAYNVGTGYFQIEFGLGDLIYKSKDKDSLSFIGQDFSIRYAFNSKLEAFSDFSFNQKWDSKESFGDSEFSFSPVAIGLMYRINDGEKAIPTMSVRAKALYYENLLGDSKADLSFMFITQHQLFPHWVFITNWSTSRVITNLDLGVTATITNVVATNWAWFAEYNFNYLLTEDSSASFLNAGISYLLNNNIQLDFFGGTSLTLDTEKEIKYLSVGISWRLERKDKRKYNAPHGSERVDPRVYQKYKNKGVK
jgi:hypothetical protein